MQQIFWVGASNATIINGIEDFKNMMYGQTDIKPEVYLSIFAYLNKYVESIKPKEAKSKDNKTQQENTKLIKTTVYCKNSSIVEDYKKIEKKLYNQTKIPPEVYLAILDKINEYIKILERQEETGIAEIPEKQTATKNETTETETENTEENIDEEKTTDTEKGKSKNLDLSNIKQFF